MWQGVVSVCKASIAGSILVVNTLVVFGCMIPIALLKFALPHPLVRRATDRILNSLVDHWVAGNGAWMALVQEIRWDVCGISGLNPRGWYIISSNHQSWVDILVLQHVFRGRVPTLKFFLKRELMYVPVMGLAWWALDFPFMRRSGGKERNREDLAAAQTSCERFRAVPTTVINFVEGTRYTQHKARAQRTPYRHLLKPRVGGMTAALATLGDRLDALLDVTIVYPLGVPSYWQLLSGQVQEIVVRVRALSVPPALAHSVDVSAPACRDQVQAWMKGLWEEKDHHIDALLRMRDEKDLSDLPSAANPPAS